MLPTDASRRRFVEAAYCYEDWPEPARKRHLLRLWLTLA